MHIGLCSDDFLQADKLKKQLDGMVKAPPAVLALTGLQFGDDGAQECTPCRVTVKAISQIAAGARDAYYDSQQWAHKD